MDKLIGIFELQAALMRRYYDMALLKGNYMPAWPIDITKKIDQQACRDTGLKAVEELFEALQHLKNWKPHRSGGIKEFDRSAFIEEIVDSLHYILEMLIFIGVTPEELYDAYVSKNLKNHKRIDDGY
jgi:dimeric dUTPase (all-alpha-NTP-PPase superfamily)